MKKLLRLLPDFRWILVVAAAVGLWMPLASVEWLGSYEISGYVLRTVEWAAEMRAGHLYPLWTPDLYGGYGEPLFIFFAPVVYVLAGSLSAAFLDPFYSLKFVALLGSVLAGTGTYRLILRQTGDRNAAFLGAVAYLAAPFRISDVLIRGDFAEFSCLAVLPAVMDLYLASAQEVRPFHARMLAAGASIVHALMILSHTVLGLWGSVIVGLVVGAQCIVLISRGMWRRVPMLVLALACAPAIAGFYIVPALAYRDLSHAAGMVLGLFAPQNQWIALRMLFDSQHYFFGKNFFQVGPILVVATLATAAAAVLNIKRARPAIAWLALSFVLIAVMLPNATPLWAPGVIPLGQFIQFPWRLLGPAVLGGSVALGLAMAILNARLGRKTRTGIAFIGAAALLLLLARPFVSVTEMRRADILSDPESMRATIQPATSADEFLPFAVPHPPTTPAGALVASTTDASVELSLSDGSRHTLVVNAARPGAVMQFKLHGFPGWRLTNRSGPAAAILETDSGGLLLVRFPSAGKYQFHLYYGTPLAVHIGRLVTGLALLTLCGMLLRHARWRPGSIRMLLPLRVRT